MLLKISFFILIFRTYLLDLPLYIESHKKTIFIRGVRIFAIYSKYFSHVYIILGEKINSDEWMVRIWFKPMISLIWIGALITSLGGLLSLLG